MQTPSQLTARYLLRDLIPKLKTIESRITTSLTRSLGSDDKRLDKARLEELKTEFELEVMMIRLNLEHLLARYPELEAANRKDSEHLATIVLDLDAKEAEAVSRAETLYRRMQEYS